MKKVTAQTSITTYVDCPKCDYQLDIDGQVESEDQFGGENLDYKFTCPDCGEEFIVDKIVY